VRILSPLLRHFEVVWPVGQTWMNFVESFGTENQFKLRKSNQWSAAKSIRRSIEDARTIVGPLSLRKEFGGWSWRYPKQFCLESNIFSLRTDFYRQDNDLYSRAIIYLQDICSRSRIESAHCTYTSYVDDALVWFRTGRSRLASSAGWE